MLMVGSGWGMIEKEIGFIANDSFGEVGAISLRPEKPRWILVFAHGVGAGIRQAFMSGMAQNSAKQGMARPKVQFISLIPSLPFYILFPVKNKFSSIT